MKVLFVINSIYTKGNGLATSARRTVRYLKEAGVDVRVLSAKNPDPNGEQPDFPLKEYTLPLIGFLVRKQGFAFAEINRDVIHEAVAWADVIHLEEPFDLEIAVAKEAIEQGVPMTATYHLHPENLFATAHLQNDPYFNRMTMRFWRNHIYNLCEIVQCPTENVRQRLAKWHYKAELRVISNGLTIEEGVPSPQQSDLTLSNAKYRIITIGRYSVEKDLITLLKSMKYSAFSQDIELVLAGRGPTEHTLKKYADKLYKKGILRYPVQFGFFALPDLQKLAEESDLYVHCAIIEVEGLSCMEAIRVGLVPVIAKGKLTATSQFALSEKSVYTAKKPKELARRIDYWLAHEEERKEEAVRYKGMDRTYDINKSVSQLISMFEDAIAKKEAKLLKRKKK